MGTKPAIRRLARRGGVKRISGLIYEETRGVPGERDKGRCNLYRARQEEDCHRHGRGLRPQETGTHPLRLWWLSCCLKNKTRRVVVCSTVCIFADFFGINCTEQL